MKKLLSTSIAIILMVAMLLTFAGCNEKNKFVGTWETELDMSGCLNAGFEQSDMGEYVKIEDFTIICSITYSNDGTYEIEVDADSVQAAFENAKDPFKKGLIKYFEDELGKFNEEQGTEMTVDEMLNAAGVDLDELVNEAFNKETVDEAIEELNLKGNFKVEDGKLFTTESINDDFEEDVYETYILDDDTLTLTKGFGGDEDDVFGDLYPIILTKVK